MIVEDLRCWTATDGYWRRVSEDQLKAWMVNLTEDPLVFYLDRQELAQVSPDPDRYRLERQAGQSSSKASKSDQGKRGRPAGSGTFADSDAPLLGEMRALLKDGTARSLHQASMLVAPRAEGGGTTESKARRLRDAYGRKWPNGEQIGSIFRHISLMRTAQSCD